MRLPLFLSNDTVEELVSSLPLRATRWLKSKA